MTCSMLPESELSLDRAKQLNKAMVMLALEREGLGKAPWCDITLLRGASLVELALAGGMVEADENSRPPNADGSRSFSMVCDDRLVASIYAFLHFAIPPAHTPDDDDHLILKVTDTSHTYFLMCGARENKQLENEDEEDAA